MSHKAFFLRLAEAVNVRGLHHVGQWFTEDFRLHEPGIDLPSGHDGARLMLQLLQKLGPTMKVEVLDVIEEGDRAAVRWLFSGEKDGRSWFPASPCIGSSMDVSPTTGAITSNKGPWP